MKRIIVVFLFLMGCGKCPEFVKDFNSDILSLEYFKNGNIESIMFLKDGKRHGRNLIFYPNGKLKVDAKYNNDICSDILTHFDSLGNIEVIYKIIVQNNRPFINEEIQYNKNGEIDIEKSRYISLHPSKDTLSKGEKFVLKIRLEASAYPQNKKDIVRKVFFNGLDNQYNIIDLKNLKVINLGDKKEVVLNIFPTCVGNQTVRGFLLEKEQVSKKSTSLNAIFFSQDYYVKGDTLISHYAYDLDFWKLVKDL